MVKKDKQAPGASGTVVLSNGLGQSYGPVPRAVLEDALRAAVKFHVAMVGRVGVLAPDVG